VKIRTTLGLRDDRRRPSAVAGSESDAAAAHSDLRKFLLVWLPASLLVMLSVILKASHPLGPVFGADAASPGPDVGRIVVTVPLESPHFF